MSVDELPKEHENPSSPSNYLWLRTIGLCVAAAWIVIGAVFYLIRFSLVFYQSNKGSIDEALRRLTH